MRLCTRPGANAVISLGNDSHSGQFVIIFAPEMKSERIQETFGNIDIYLFDQLLKGTYDGCHTILDAGCGTG